VADALKEVKIDCFGPTKDAAQIESDKKWAKIFMDRYKIPTARWGAFTEVEHAKKFINKCVASVLLLFSFKLCFSSFFFVKGTLTQGLHSRKKKETRYYSKVIL